MDLQSGIILLQLEIQRQTCFGLKFLSGQKCQGRASVTGKQQYLIAKARTPWTFRKFSG